MQDAKGTSESPMQKNKGKLHERDSYVRHGWPWHTFIMLFFVGAALMVFGVANFNLAVTTPDSARYMLSALVQSQAAILAIVISLTLIAVQLTSSTYSPRVIKIFKDSISWQALFVLYGISIFYGLLILRAIRDTDPNQITFLHISLDFWISLAYVFGVLTFAILILYVLYVIDFLDPANIINRLATEITKENLLNSEEDPIQPIIDIVHGSIMKYDIATTRVGLKAVTERVIKVIDSQSEIEISELFCNHLERVGRLAISKEDEESAVEVSKNLEKFCISTFEKGLKKTKVPVLEALAEVSKIAGRRGLREVLEIANATHTRVNDLNITRKTAS